MSSATLAAKAAASIGHGLLRGAQAARELEPLLDYRAYLFYVRGEFFAQLGRLYAVEAQLHARKRRAQVVAHRFEHVVALRQVALYAREHFVEGARDLAHFVISALRQRRGGLGVRAEALDRFAKPFEAAASRAR